MIKTIAYYPLQRALNGGPPMNAMLSALRTAGIETQERSQDSDALLIWSALWSGRMAANQAVYRHYRAQDTTQIDPYTLDHIPDAVSTPQVLPESELNHLAECLTHTTVLIWD